MLLYDFFTGNFALLISIMTLMMFSHLLSENMTLPVELSCGFIFSFDFKLHLTEK